MNEFSEVTRFSDALSALSDTSKPYPPRFLRSYSDLSPKQLKDLMAVWPSIPLQRKVSLLEDLESVMEADTLVSFDALARKMLTDPEPAVRIPALRLLWECEEPAIIPDLISICAHDDDESARATSAALLGKFVLLGELDAIKPALKDLVTDQLVNVVLGSDQPRVKQRALESLGYSSHPAVPELIRNAYESSDIPWITSALCAMGCSADDVWAHQVENMISSPEPEVQFEAIRAAGELELSSAREPLLSMLEEDIEDEEIRLALIWALSQIGGSDVKEKLEELLDNASTDDEIEWIEKAIENLDIASSGNMELLDFSPGDEDDEDETDSDKDDDFEDADLYEEDLEDDEED